MKQIIVIHGVDTFDSYDDYLAFLQGYEIDKSIFCKGGWKENLPKDVGGEYEVLLPSMPNKFNAKYLEWKIWFEKMIPLFEPEIILIGYSLGGIFLAKYLAENNFSKKAKALFLVAAPFNDVDIYSLADFGLPTSLEKCAEQVENIFIYQSEDDPVVPFFEAAKYQEKLPKAQLKIFKDMGHFNQDNFPELVEQILSL
jgi:predicted alpha/beta hydrolase family esterase